MPKKILLADDSITIQKVVELTFSDGDYEVTAVNNGAKAVQKLAEMRPDIILSDIIMPEKNGYEVCEYVKSHPEFRTIPVILLTGTFEPFDPDRAEKAGCDAVVTKPFESQSLIHKVEELIAQAKTANYPVQESEPEPPAPEPSPWNEPQAEEEPPASSGSPFSTASGGYPAVTPPEAFTHGSDLFDAVPVQGGSADMPFETPAESPEPFGEPPSADEFSGETRAFPKMTFDEIAQMSAPAAAEMPLPPPEPSPWDEPAGSPFGAEPDFSVETRAYTREDLAMPAEPEPEPEAPFDAPPAAETSPWDEPAEREPSPFGTQAVQALNFDELSRAASPEPEPEPEPAPAEPSPWDEPIQTDFSAETSAFPKMTFDELSQMASTPQPASEQEPAMWEEPPAWSPVSDMNRLDSAGEPSHLVEEPPIEEPVAEELAPAVEELPVAEPAPEPEWFSEPQAEAAPEPEEEQPEAIEEEPAVAAAPAVAPETEPSIPIAARDLTEDQIDRIARRVVELMSEQVVRNIAWEVIPDMAEMVVKERIRQLESEN